MPLKNYTPLQCLPLDSLTPEGEKTGVVLVRVTLDLVPGNADLKAQGQTHQLKLSQVQNPLTFTDIYHGEFLNSSIRWESDAAPAKPRCDVILLGDAHAPGGKPHYYFPVGLKIAAQAKASPSTGETILEKRLGVHGERWLKRRNFLVRAFWWSIKMLTFGLVRRCPWHLTRPKGLTTLPLRYEYAFGGHAQMHASAPAARKVPKRACLPGVDLVQMRDAWKKARKDALLAESFWAENPVGRGYAPSWYLKATHTKWLPAPQIEDQDHPFTAKAAWKAMTGKAHGKFRHPLRPQGLGVITRNWEPRLRFAGTWDEAWVASGAPYPPDYTEAFNNYAHPDLQCRHLDGDEIVELTNLCSPAMAGMGRDSSGNQVLRFGLPGLFPFLAVVQETGEVVLVPAVLDTLILEPDESRVTLLHRARFAAEPGPVGLELRLAMPGEPRAVQFESEDTNVSPDLK